MSIVNICNAIILSLTDTSRAFKHALSILIILRRDDDINISMSGVYRKRWRSTTRTGHYLHFTVLHYLQMVLPTRSRGSYPIRHITFIHCCAKSA